MGHPGDAASERGISRCSGISGIRGMSSGQTRSNGSLLPSSLTTLQEEGGKVRKKPQKSGDSSDFWGSWEYPLECGIPAACLE